MGTLKIFLLSFLNTLASSIGGALFGVGVYWLKFGYDEGSEALIGFGLVVGSMAVLMSHTLDMILSTVSASKKTRRKKHGK